LDVIVDSVVVYDAALVFCFEAGSAGCAAADWFASQLDEFGFEAFSFKSLENAF
jgi:hypothetical protein